MKRLLTIMLCCVAGAAVAADSDLAGHWEGNITLPHTLLEIDLDIANTDGQWSGDISIPAQGAVDLPLVRFDVDDETAVFVIRDIPGDATFNGFFAAGGDSLMGAYIQAGQRYAFRLSRAPDPIAGVVRDLESLGDTIAEVLAEWETPGLSVAVVKGSQVVLVEGYGVRDVAKELPVTPNTLFAIGSSTKAFTTFAMGQLVDGGLLDWDAPVRNYLPEFQLYDEYATDHVTPRDLVTHRTGLPRHDFVWYGNDSMERAELVSRVAHLQPNKALRELWQYNNLMFTTAGYMVGRLRGSTWEEAVREGIFERLGMTRSNFSVDVSQADPDHARPYQSGREAILEVPFRNLDAIGPAGSINSCANDMARWLLANLGHGDSGLDAATLTELHTPQMVMPGMPGAAHMTPRSYAMGWFADTWRGRYRVDHGGNIDGFSSAVWLFPVDDVGISVQSNRTADPVPDLIAAVIADLVLELEPMDHVRLAGNRRVLSEATAEESRGNQDRYRVRDTKTSRDVEAFAGVYGHPGYGELEITVDDDEPALILNGMTLPLEHWHYDVWAVRAGGGEAMLSGIKLNFLGDEAGRLSRLEIGLETTLAPIVFERRVPDVMTDPEYLARLLGRYEIPPQIISIALQGETLVARLPGQPSYTLVPLGDDEFELAELNGYSLKFTLEAEGPATEAVFIQPNGVFAAQRVAED